MRGCPAFVCLATEGSLPGKAAPPSPAPLQAHTPRIMLPAGNRQMIRKRAGSIRGIGRPSCHRPLLSTKGLIWTREPLPNVKDQGWPSPCCDGSLRWELGDYGVQSPTDGEIITITAMKIAGALSGHLQYATHFMHINLFFFFLAALGLHCGMWA